MRRVLLPLVLVLSLTSSAQAAPVPTFTAKPPASAPMPPGTEAFWAELHEKTTRAVEEMIGKSGKELGYSRSQYTAGDFKCMSWFVAWAIAEGTRRSNPRLCPESFTKWLEKNQTRACSPDDPDDKGPGASTGRGWNTVRAQVLSARAMHMEVSTDSTGVVDVLAVLRGVAGLGVGVGFRAVTAAPASAGGVLVDPCVLNPRAPFCPQPSDT